MAKTDEEKEISKIFKKTKKSLEELNIYRPQFEQVVKTYAEMKQQYNMLNRQFYKSGCKIVEEYTNKAGATNMRKTALYLAMETMRKDIIYYENQLGLTPVAIKKINDAIIKSKNDSPLLKVIQQLEGNKKYAK